MDREFSGASARTVIALTVGFAGGVAGCPWVPRHRYCARLSRSRLICWAAMDDLITSADLSRHVPIVLTSYDEDGLHTYETPAEVCGGCSDFDAGRLIPVSFCPIALGGVDE